MYNPNFTTINNILPIKILNLKKYFLKEILNINK